MADGRTAGPGRGQGPIKLVVLDHAPRGQFSIGPQRCGPAAAATDPTVQQIATFAQRSLRCSAVVFYWVRAGAPGSDALLLGMSPGSWLEYISDMVEMDPLSVPALMRARMDLARLPAQASVPRRYLEFLDRQCIRDVVDMLFTIDGVVIAGLGALKTDADEPLSPGTLELAGAARPLVEVILRQHPAVRQATGLRALSTVHRLTPRELAVARLVADGLSNQDVADHLRIALPTVKSHLASIFGKTATQTRHALAALVGRVLN